MNPMGARILISWVNAFQIVLRISWVFLFKRTQTLPVLRMSINQVKMLAQKLGL